MIENYKRYNLQSTNFNQEQFEATLGGKLSEAGLEDTRDSIILEGEQRLFLTHPLSSNELHTVNSAETIKSAQMAARFQEKVAQTIISDTHEPLVNLRELPKEQSYDWTFTDARYHAACGEWAGEEKLFWVREKIAGKLSRLALSLSNIGLKLHFEDGFRPLGVQEGLFKRRINMAKTAHPEWGDEECLLEAKSKTAYTPRFAAHKAGAAVDVRLADANSHDFLDIGHGYPDGGEIVRLETPYVTQEQWQNRKVLEKLSQAAGFTMYPFEDWHLCHDDATAAAVNGTPGNYHANYGPVKRFDSSTGEILEIYQQDELDATFSTT